MLRRWPLLLVALITSILLGLWGLAARAIEPVNVLMPAPYADATVDHRNPVCVGNLVEHDSGPGSVNTADDYIVVEGDGRRIVFPNPDVPVGQRVGLVIAPL